LDFKLEIRIFILRLRRFRRAGLAAAPGAGRGRTRAGLRARVGGRVEEDDMNVDL